MNSNIGLMKLCDLLSENEKKRDGKKCALLIFYINEKIAKNETFISNNFYKVKAVKKHFKMLQINFKLY